MTNQPLVSVVFIFCNAERFIQEAIESVFEQPKKRIGQFSAYVTGKSTADQAIADAKKRLEASLVKFPL